MRLLVTGGCGFIGSNFVQYVLDARPDLSVVVFDSLTYAGNLENLAELINNPRFRFVFGDVADGDAVSNAGRDVDAIVNFAAESHVDRSILDAAPFVRTNVIGTQVLLEVTRRLGVSRYLQVSTDEVYGSLGPRGRFEETTPLAPNSPYSASKAAADLLVRAYAHTHGVPAMILRSSNVYGPYQFPEKLIPLTIANALAGEPLPVYGDGRHVRDWIHVSDCVRAVLAVLERGTPGETYNIGGGNELENLTVVTTVVSLTGASPSLIRFVPDRPGHDRRYAMNHDKITRELGWRPERPFPEGLADTVEWYRANGDWIASVQSGGYRDYYEQQYRDRLAAGSVRPMAAAAVASPLPGAPATRRAGSRRVGRGSR